MCDSATHKQTIMTENIETKNKIEELREEIKELWSDLGLEKKIENVWKPILSGLLNEKVIYTLCMISFCIYNYKNISFIFF